MQKASRHLRMGRRAALRMDQEPLQKMIRRLSTREQAFALDGLRMGGDPHSREELGVTNSKV